MLAEKVIEGPDAVAFGEYMALLEYKLQRRDDLDRQIEALALAAPSSEHSSGDRETRGSIT